MRNIREQRIDDISKMNESLISELSSLYGVGGPRGGAINGALRALECAAENNRAYLVIKFDGGRDSRKYTAIFNSADSGVGVIRMDGDDLAECVNYLLASVVMLKKDGKIN